MSGRWSILLALSTIAVSACSPSGSLDVDVDDPAIQGSDARGIAIERIALYQGVEIDLVRDGDSVTDATAPVIENRDGMLRVFVERDSDFEDREITAILTLDDGVGEDILQERLFVQDDSEQDELATTFNFDVPAELITASTSFRVSLQEEDFRGSFAGSDDASQFPIAADETEPLHTERSASIELVVIPVRYNADGSGRVPDVSEFQLSRIRNKIQALYPVEEVEVTVGQTLEWNYTVAAYGNGWSNLLQQIAYMRDGASVDANTYYYGLFTPDSSMGSYCAGGCVAGLSLLGSEHDEWSRASIGLGFTGEDTVDTLAHEVGHAHGREHAPCGLGGQQSDPWYPHANAGLGSWGYDTVSGELKDPNRYVDMMSYCSPLWISDYTYDQMLDRVQALDLQARPQLPGEGAIAQQSWRSISIDGDGAATMGHTFTLDRAPRGEATTVVVDGIEVSGVLTRFDHLPGGILMVPEADVRLLDQSR